jgi:tRNA A37 threonylcarbamoyladenosine dehydratase
MMKHDRPHIDQNALSRQLAVYGHEAQGKLMAMKVFIHGISGVYSILYRLASKLLKI